VIAEQNGRREVGSAAAAGASAWATSDDQIASYVDEAVKAALTNLEAAPRRPAR
jgi:TldD protein